jgi:hypothetical protein
MHPLLVPALTNAVGLTVTLLACRALGFSHEGKRTHRINVSRRLLIASAFGSGLLGVLLCAGSVSSSDSKPVFSKAVKMLGLGDWFPSLIGEDARDVYARSVGFLFVIWSLSKAVIGTGSTDAARRFLRFNCWAVGMWPFLLAASPGNNLTGILAFSIIFSLQLAVGFMPRFQ